jgi:hypothetical protein
MPLKPLDPADHYRPHIYRPEERERWSILDADIPFRSVLSWMLKFGGAAAIVGASLGLLISFCWFVLFAGLAGLALSR